MHAKRILIVDEDHWSSHLLKENLERTGHYVVQEVNDSAEALGAARQFHPDIILLDTLTPPAGGNRLAESIHADPLLRDIPLVFQTAGVLGCAPVLSRELGSPVLISKSASLHELVSCVDRELAAPGSED